MDDDWGYPYDSGNLHIVSSEREEEIGAIAFPRPAAKSCRDAKAPSAPMQTDNPFLRQPLLGLESWIKPDRLISNKIYNGQQRGDTVQTGTLCLGKSEMLGIGDINASYRNVLNIF